MKNKQYSICHLHSHYSLLDSISKPKDIAKKCVELDIPACAITDHGSASGHLQFLTEMQKVEKKALLGIEFYISKEDVSLKDDTNRKLNHLVLIAKNKKGWNSLIKAISTANYQKFFYYKPRLDIDRLSDFVGDLIAIDGHLGSVLSTKIFPNNTPDCSSEKELKEHINPNWINNCTEYIEFMQEVFGKENFFLEIQLMDRENSLKSWMLAKGIRYLGYKLGIPVVPTPDSHYINKEDAQLQRIMLCSSMNITLDDVYNKQKNGKDVGLSSFFRSRNYYIPSYEEMFESGCTEEELENTLMVADLCEEYELKHPPILPKFPLPQNTNSDEHLKELCRKGWVERLDEIKKHVKHTRFTKQNYVDRLEEEFKILSEAGLSDYFLIVEDVVKYARENDSLIGCGRGSASGSLVLWLLGVTQVNPIEYDLLFSRFYNSARKNSLADVDLDFQHSFKDNVLEYLKNKYGRENVSQICTFSRLQGRSALKEVLRVNSVCDFATANEISKPIPDEAKIAGELQEMKEETGESGIILWALQNNKKELEKYAYIDDDGEIQGDYALHFKQAIKLEGTIKASSRHAAGVAIANEPLENICPMMYDKNSKEQISAFDLDSLEKVGVLKLDVLSTAVLDKIHCITNLLSTGKLNA